MVPMLHCPFCLNPDIRRSPWRWPTVLWLLILFRVFRCQTCGREFAAFCWAPLTSRRQAEGRARTTS